jgi:hypothetical protein
LLLGFEFENHSVTLRNRRMRGLCPVSMQFPERSIEFKLFLG